MKGGVQKNFFRPSGLSLVQKKFKGREGGGEGSPRDPPLDLPLSSEPNLLTLVNHIVE